MRMTVVSLGVLATVAGAAPALAIEFPAGSVAVQTAPADPWVVTRARPTTVSDRLFWLSRSGHFCGRCWEDNVHKTVRTLYYSQSHFY